MGDEGGQQGDVGVELDLAGEVEEDEVFVCEGLEGGGEEVEVLQEESVNIYCQSLSAAKRESGEERLTHSKHLTSPPLGPRPISSITSSRLIRSRISRSGVYSKSEAAGSRFT